MLNQKALLFILAFMLCSTLPAGVSGEGRFTDNGDGTVTDHQLHLMWAKTDNQGDMSWKEAQQWVRYTFPYTLDTHYDNWRLPTLAELKSLYVDKHQYQGYEADCGQWVKIVPEIRISCGWIWTSESSAIQATVFNFHRGYHYQDRMVHKKAYRVLAVRPLK
jgi:hypothetical protein